jgi:hypothetical protein
MPDTELSQAIETLYLVFAKYPLTMVEGCGCCVIPEHNERIHSKPLRQLTTNDLKHYRWKAMTTWGDVTDFKHFLPRLLELYSADWLDEDFFMLASKLNYGQWRDWPTVEQPAIEAYLLDLWKDCRTKRLNNVVEVITTISELVFDLSSYLNAWQQAIEFSPAIENLVMFINYITVRDGQVRDMHRDQSDQIIQWLQTPALHQLLEAKFFQYTDNDVDLSTYISAALDRIRWLIAVK